jgi:NAD(P)-dependent dehydrogenase (short-subunit alcohol dehydrogenase family)
MIFNMSEEEWDAVIAVHLKGHFCTTKPASVIFRQQRYGRIVNFSSGSGLNGLPGQANYGAAKAGVAGFTRVVARDLGRYAVTCNAISPGAATRMTATVPEASRELRSRAGIQTAGGPPQRQSGIPAMREPEYVAPMTVFLCTDEAWNINGKIFQVAGGGVGLLQEEVPMRTITKAGGAWTVDELRELIPMRMMAGLPNPAPPPRDLEIPGRPVAG